MLNDSDLKLKHYAMLKLKLDGYENDDNIEKNNLINKIK